MKSMEFATLSSRSSLGRFIKIWRFNQNPGIAQYLVNKKVSITEKIGNWLLIRKHKQTYYFSNFEIISIVQAH
jgi:hypothetical protein